MGEKGYPGEILSKTLYKDEHRYKMTCVLAMMTKTIGKGMCNTIKLNGSALANPRPVRWNISHVSLATKLIQWTVYMKKMAWGTTKWKRKQKRYWAWDGTPSPWADAVCLFLRENADLLYSFSFIQSLKSTFNLASVCMPSTVLSSGGSKMSEAPLLSSWSHNFLGKLDKDTQFLCCAVY